MARQRHPRTEPAHTLLYEPGRMQVTRVLVPSEELLPKISQYLENPFNSRQQAAFRSSFTNRITLLWGPPGTGKTTVVAGIILGWIENAWCQEEPASIGVGASNYNAIDNVLQEVADLLEKREATLGPPSSCVRIARLRSQSAKPPLDARIEDIARASDAWSSLADSLNDHTEQLIVGGTWAQFGHLARDTSNDRKPVATWFDLLAIDEASQVPVATAAAYFLLLREDAHVILAGDHKQLGPIYGFEMRDSAHGLFDCIFSYMQETHGQAPVALDCNYRTNTEISGWPRERFYREGYEAFFPERRLDITIPPASGKPVDGWPENLPWSDLLFELLEPDIPIVVVSYNNQLATLSNMFEAQMVSSIALAYRHLLEQQHGVSEQEFWSECLGIVTPHRAQMSLIRNLLMDMAGTATDSAPFVDTVDRFQGQERDLIIASYVVSDRDFIAAEEAFILNPRRFNVTLTRARSKFIMFISDALLQHLPADAEVARDAAHLQLFVENYCTTFDQEIELPYLDKGEPRIRCRLRGRRDIP